MKNQKFEQMTLFKMVPKWSAYNAFPMTYVINQIIKQVLIKYIEIIMIMMMIIIIIKIIIIIITSLRPGNTGLMSSEA